MKQIKHFPRVTTIHENKNGVTTITVKDKLKEVYDLASAGVKQSAAIATGVKLPNYLHSDKPEKLKERVKAIETAQAKHVQDSQERLNQIKVIAHEVIRG